MREEVGARVEKEWEAIILECVGTVIRGVFVLLEFEER